MKVILIENELSPHLSTGLEYTVVETYDNDVRIIDDGGAPALYPLSFFKVVDPELPSSWRVSRDEDGVESKAPETFMVRGFFERVWDLESEAITHFLEIANLDTGARRRFDQWVAHKVDVNRGTNGKK